MEHLPLKQPLPQLTPPHIGGLVYGGQGFWTFPKSLGWEYDKLNGTLEGGTTDELGKRLQAWLYFGLLSEVTKVEFDRADFVGAESGNSSAVTTTALPRLMQAWKDRTTSLDIVERRKEGVRASSLLDEVSKQLWLFNGQIFLQPECQLAHVEPSIILSLALLTQALSNASKLIFSSLMLDGIKIPWHVWPDPGVIGQERLKRHLFDNGWCSSLVTQAFLNLDIDAVMYVISLGSCRVVKDHSTCTEQICYALQTSGVQRPRHVNEGCNCVSLSADNTEIRRLIDLRKIPLLSIDRKLVAEPGEYGYELCLNVKEYEPGDMYVALSHVCAEDTGNTETNDMPHCWFERLFELLRSIVYYNSKGEGWRFSATHSPVWFWMDTICVPVQPQYQNLRDTAVQDMHRIYEDAARVLVFDAELQQVSHDAKPNEVLAKTLLCGWRQRLWTLQEGVLCLDVEVALKGNRTVSIKRLINYDQSWAPSLCHSVDFNLRSALQKVLQFPHLALHDNKGEREPDRIREQRMLSAFRDQFASRGGDETICIATFLGLDPGPLLGLPEVERMPNFLLMLPHVPDNVLSAGGPRLEKPAFRWAPKTLLAPHGIGTIIQESLTIDSESGPSMTVRRPPNVLTSQGLYITLPGLRLTREKAPLPDLVNGMLFIIWNQSVFGISLIKSDFDCFGPVASAFGTENSLAIVLSGPVLLSRDQAVLVADGTDENGTINARYCCRIGVIGIADMDPPKLQRNYPPDKIAHAETIWPVPRWCID